ncbi:hypothetical protein HK096_010610, partial [Nowakowskiella sp. JEL0078]
MSFVMAHIYSKLLGPVVQKLCLSNATTFSQHSAIQAFSHHLLLLTGTSNELAYLSLFYVYILSTKRKQTTQKSNTSILVTDLKHTSLEEKSQSQTISNSSENNSPLEQQEQSLKISPRALVVTTLMLAHKAYEDKRRNNSAWAQISGMKTDVLNMAERECLASMDYRLHISAHVFESWTKSVMKSVHKSVFEARKKATVCQALSMLKDRISGYRVEIEGNKSQIEFDR